MNTNSGKIKFAWGSIPLHPFLLASYFVLALLGLNISQVFPSEALRSLVAVLLLSGILVLTCRLAFKDWQRGALAASWLLVLFFSYGHIYQFLETSAPGLGRHRLLLPIWAVLAGFGLWWISRRAKNISTLTTAVNLVALVALVFPAYQITSWQVRQAQEGRAPAVDVPGLGSLSRLGGQAPPDVYFFVLDMYARQDVLKDVYNFDNSAFLADLKKMGFNIVECSQSNYSQTEMVLTSILNMDYLDALGNFDPASTDPLALRQLVKDNAVIRSFKALGYKLVSFETGFHFSEFYNADYYLSAGAGNAIQLGRMNTFEVMLIKSTASLALFDFTKILPGYLIPDISQPLETKRQQVLFDLDELQAIPRDITGPKFVFVHLLALHEPFVFSPSGGPVSYPENLDAEQYYAAYRDQLVFLNSRLLPILSNIIENSSPKPIIILQGDTGPGLVSHPGRMANLSAFYLPGYDQPISATLTPVNDFRLIFSHYFGASLGLLPDKSYFSLYTAPFTLDPVPNTCVP